MHSAIIRTAPVLLLVLLSAGCGPSVSLVADPPLPPFGPRNEVAYRPAGQRPKESSKPSADPSKASWVPTVAENQWRYIVIHHSPTHPGDAAMFDREHRQRGWNGLGYHFVVGNGTLSKNGEIEVGPRWTAQTAGAHAGVRDHPEYNQYGIGICLVGNFNESVPSDAQMKSLLWLVRGLMQRYHIPKSRVLGHGMLKPTDCPGRNFNFKVFYAQL